MMGKNGSYQLSCGDVYEGGVKDGKPNGRGICRITDGRIFDGNWKDGLPHGSGAMIQPSGDVFEGQWLGGEVHGKVKVSSQNGDVYEGDWVAGDECRFGTVKRKDGSVYEGETKDCKPHGKGTLKCEGGVRHEGQWVKGKRHGPGTLAFRGGEVFEGRWAEGLLHNGKGTLKAAGRIYEGEWTDGVFSANVEGDVRNYALRSPGTYCEDSPSSSINQKQHIANCPCCKGKHVYGLERQTRSQRSQQQRLQRNVAPKRCEHCGVDDGLYKLRVCSGCNLALYCSADCQKAARRSHRRICDILSMLPSGDSDRLTLAYDKDNMVDLDAGLRYATKYMDSLKHLTINLVEMKVGDAIKLSRKHLSSLLRSKKGGALESVILKECSPIGDEVWKELHDLKQLWLYNMSFDDVKPICDIIDQQEGTLEVLRLTWLQIDWQKAKIRRAFALAVNSCKHLVKLDLQGVMLMDPDLKVMLQGLPNLRNLDLTRDFDNSHEFTDNTCGLIARKCPGLQELNLYHHNQLSMRGVRKIFEGCPHLRTFYTSSRKLSCNDVQNLLDIAPQLICLILDSTFYSVEGVTGIIEATGGRTVLRFVGRVDEQHLSDTTGEKYQQQNELFLRIQSKRDDPRVANEWEELLEG